MIEDLWNHLPETGSVSLPALAPLLDRVRLVPGSFIEIGVFRGRTYRALLAAAASGARRCYAVDSFRGMAEPGPEDGSSYPAGKFDVGGTAALRRAVEQDGHADWSCIIEGWVPAVFSDPQLSGILLAFAHVDLDHYQPTLDALRWLWPRMAHGGLIAVHDYFNSVAGLASGAVRRFAVEEHLAIQAVESSRGVTSGISRHAVFEKGGSQ